MTILYRVDPVQKLIHQLESQRVLSKACSPFNASIWPLWKFNGEGRLIAYYCDPNEVMPATSAAVPDLLELQYKLKSKAAKWYTTTDTANTFFLYFYSTRVQVTVCFLLNRHPVHLESTVPAVEMHPSHLTWTDPDRTGEKVWGSRTPAIH